MIRAGTGVISSKIVLPIVVQDEQFTVSAPVVLVMSVWPFCITSRPMSKRGRNHRAY